MNRHTIYALYQNHIMGTWLGALPSARLLDRLLFRALFVVPPACVVAVIIVYLLWRYR